MPLTDAAVKRLKPADKDAFHADSNGVYLRVATSGSKTFLYRSRSGGLARWVKLGSYPTITLADARNKAVALSTGMLPSHITVRAVYDEWMVHIRKTYKSPQQVQQRMDTHFIPRFESLKTSSITRAQLSNLLTEVAASAPVQANRLLTNIKLMFAYAVERGWLENSPAEILTRKTVGGKEKSRDRVLTSAELTALMQELTGERFGPPIRYALFILLVSGQRSGEVRGLLRDELRVDGWYLPPYRTKNGTACSVLLPNACLKLIRTAIAELGPEPFKGMDRQQLARAVKRMGATWTPHDLRRTMATGMADLGVAPHVIEKCLNHTMGGVMAIYNRSEYATEKKAAWRLWVRYLLTKRKAPIAGG